MSNELKIVIKEEPELVDEGDNPDSAEQDESTLVDEVGTVDDYIEIEDSEEEEELNNGKCYDSNNHDNEESINLTIGEEEQKLLHDEDANEKEMSTTHADDANNTVPSNIREEEINDEQSEFQKEIPKSVGNGNDKDYVCGNVKNGVEVEDKKKNKESKSERIEKIESNEQKSSTASKSISQKDEKEKNSSAAATTGVTTKLTDSKSNKILTASSRNLWVSALSALTRASDLKTIFSKYGKVIGAKVVTNTRTPGTRCYGYVTMATSGDASRCIEHLHRTELHGRIISVERTKNEIGGNASNASATGAKVSASNSTSSTKRKDDEKLSRRSSLSKEVSGKGTTKTTSDKRTSSRSRKTSKDISNDKSKSSKNDNEKTVAKDEESKEKATSNDKTKSETSVKPHRRSSKSGERTARRPHTSAERERDRERDLERRQRERERERERIRQREILSYQKIREERERQRLRERERELREEERRRRETRERQRQEEARLAEERRKLAQERERLEREKAELLRLERERQKLEREKIELERLELKRQQMKIIQTTRIDEPTVKQRGVKRPTDDRYGVSSGDRKRQPINEGRFDAPPPPKFDAALVSRYDKKRDEYASGGGGGSSYSSAKRDDYSSSKRPEFLTAKRDDYSNSKRDSNLVNEYQNVQKRSNVDYSKRGKTDFPSSNVVEKELDGYASEKPDEYKRQVEIRHIPPANSNSNYHSAREVIAIHKNNNRYLDVDGLSRSSSNFRRGAASGLGDERNDSRNLSGSSKRYDGYGGGSDRNSAVERSNWQPVAGHNNHSHSGHAHTSSRPSPGESFGSNVMPPGWQLKSGDEPAWRRNTVQDRYDRTYNERSGQYTESSRSAGGNGDGIYGGNGRPDRYEIPISASRYENGKY